MLEWGPNILKTALDGIACLTKLKSDWKYKWDYIYRMFIWNKKILQNIYVLKIMADKGSTPWNFSLLFYH